MILYSCKSPFGISTSALGEHLRFQGLALSSAQHHRSLHHDFRMQRDERPSERQPTRREGQRRQRVSTDSLRAFPLFGGRGSETRCRCCRSWRPALFLVCWRAGWPPWWVAQAKTPGGTTQQRHGEDAGGWRWRAEQAQLSFGPQAKRTTERSEVVRAVETKF